MSLIKKYKLFVCYIGVLIFIDFILVSCDECKYSRRNPVLLDYASVTFSFYTITEDFKIKDFFAENDDYYPDSLRLFNMDHQEVYLQRTSNKNEFTFFIIDSKIKEKIFSNIIVQYYYLHFKSSDTDTMKIEMKGQYTGNCDNETFELMRMYYNNKLVINEASKGQVAFGFTYNKKD